MTRARRIQNAIGRPLAAIGALSLVACSSAAPVQQLETSSLCNRGKRVKPIRIAHIDERGQAFQGDAPRGEYDGVVKKIATAVAVAKTPVFERRVRKDCYDKAKKVWYPCVKETKIDFTKIKGIARAPKMGAARDVAVQLCESEVRKASPKAGGYIRFNSASFDCTVVQQQYCPVFKASKEQKKEKIRLKKERQSRQKYEIDPTCPSTQHCLPKRR